MIPVVNPSSEGLFTPVKLTSTIVWSLVVITEQLSDILALNTYDDGANYAWQGLAKNGQDAFSINPRDGFKELDFEFGLNTEVAFSCSVLWHNHYYVFGGRNEKRQVSMVRGNRLERKTTLDFNFNDGACTIFYQQIIVLCFDVDEGKVCRKSNNPLELFTKLPKSAEYHHRQTRIASFDGKNTI